MRGYTNQAGQDDAAYDAIIAAMETKAAASVSLLASGPQAARLVAVAEVARVSVRRELVRLGRCASARRERLHFARADVSTLAHALRVVGAGMDSIRARAEWAGTASLLEAAVAS